MKVAIVLDVFQDKNLIVSIIFGYATLEKNVCYCDIIFSAERTEWLIEIPIH